MGKGLFPSLAEAMFLFICILVPTQCMSASSSTANDLLQFRAGNHIIGFSPGKAYLVALDHALTVEFLGTPGVMPKGDGDAPATGATTKAKSLGKVVYENLWDGISLKYDPSKDGITESTYHLAPGADVEKIRLKYNVPVTGQEDGSLRFRFDKGYVRESAPIAWQDIDGKRVTVKVAFRVSDGEIGFRVGRYDPKQPLVIDPTYSWHTFYGKPGNDYGKAIALDSSGNIYVTGYSTSSWTGPSGETPLHARSGDYDMFILKLNSCGTYQWHTFYGSSDTDESHAIALDTSGNIYVTGRCYETWNGPGGESPLNPYNGSFDICILKLDSSGAYQWHTFHGSTGLDYGTSIAVDGSGNAYLTGWSEAAWDGPGSVAPLNGYGGYSDIFVLKLNTNGAYQWHTFYGVSTNYDYGNAIAVNGGDVYVAGHSKNTWKGPNNQSPLHAFTGSYYNNEIVILKLDSSGNYLWHTFYGSSNYDFGNAIAVDGSGIYVAGESNATWNGPGNAPPKNTHSGDYDIFILKLDGSGTYQWHTFQGSTNKEYCNAVALDNSGNIYLAGFGLASWNGPAGESPLSAYNGGKDSVTLKLDSSGAYQMHVFHGSVNDDFGNGVAANSIGSIYLAGESYSTWNGPAGAAPLNPHSISNYGYYDIFVLKLIEKGASVRILREGTPFNYYETIQGAYNAAADGDVIQAQELEFTEDLKIDDSIAVALKGGYSADFVLNPGMTALTGILTISGGSVTVENIAIK